jgi:hypothetical protein
MPVRFDLSGNVFAFGFEGQRGKRTAYRIDRRKGLGVLEGRHDFCVACDGDDVVVRLSEDRAVTPQILVVIVRVLGDGFVGEVVDFR